MLREPRECGHSTDLKFHMMINANTGIKAEKSKYRCINYSSFLTVECYLKLV